MEKTGQTKKTIGLDRYRASLASLRRLEHIGFINHRRNLIRICGDPSVSRSSLWFVIYWLRSYAAGQIKSYRRKHRFYDTY